MKSSSLFFQRGHSLTYVFAIILSQYRFRDHDDSFWSFRIFRSRSARSFRGRLLSRHSRLGRSRKQTIFRTCKITPSFASSKLFLSHIAPLYFYIFTIKFNSFLSWKCKKKIIYIYIYIGKIAWENIFRIEKWKDWDAFDIEWKSFEKQKNNFGMQSAKRIRPQLSPRIAV